MTIRILLLSVNMDFTVLIDAYNRLNDFEQTQSYKLLTENASLRSQLAESERRRDGYR